MLAMDLTASCSTAVERLTALIALTVDLSVTVASTAFCPDMRPRTRATSSVKNLVVESLVLLREVESEYWRRKTVWSRSGCSSLRGRSHRSPETQLVPNSETGCHSTEDNSLRINIFLKASSCPNFQIPRSSSMGCHHHGSGLNNCWGRPPLHHPVQVLLPLQQPVGESQGHGKLGRLACLPPHRDQGWNEQGVQ